MSYLVMNRKLQKKTCGLCCTKLKNFGVTIGKNQILSDINLHIHCGELTVLIGPNGAGKTTLLKAILGEIRHTGELFFLDAENRQRSPVVGYVPQRLDFDPGTPISVLDLFSAALTNWPVCLGHRHRIRERAAANLVNVQAEHLLAYRLGDLSGGELQKVLLALALDPNPDLLLLDEPISGVDARGKELFYNLVSNLRQRYDMSIILVSHDWALVSRYADRIVFLNRTVKYCATPEEVFADEELLRNFGPISTDDADLRHSRIKAI